MSTRIVKKSLAAQPLLSVYVYVIVCVPAPAIDGEKTLPLIPGPENAPPEGLPLILNPPSVLHALVIGELISTVGIALTTTV